MVALADLIRLAEPELTSRVIQYATELGYSRYTPSDGTVWKMAIRGLSEGLISALKDSPDIPEISPDLDLSNDRITAFGVEQARQHRTRGISLVRFLGLMKYFRQSYHDVIDEPKFACQNLSWAHVFVERYFDRIELGFIAEWERHAAAVTARQEQLLLDRNARLSETNLLLKTEIIERKRAEQQIRKLNLDLERRVEARTLQLNRINDKNDYKLKELLILNRLSSLNLSELRLNRLSCIILETLTSHAPLFFDRAMLFLLNERAEVLQGMLGITRGSDGCRTPGGEPDDLAITSFDESSEVWNSPLTHELRLSRIELKTGRGPVYRAVKEKRVVSASSLNGLDEQARTVFTRLGLQSWYAVMPLTGRKGIIGVIIVDNPVYGRKIHRDDIKFLQLFANQARVAIENLMLCSSLEEANRQIKETQELLVHGERLATIGEMAASIAHELKGPMVAIGGFAKRLSRSIPQGTAEAGYVTTIIDEERRLENMLDDVLSFARKTTTCFQRCSLIDIVDSSIAIMSHLFEKNRVDLVKSFPATTVVLQADAQQLKQVIVNIVHNALDAMRDGGTMKVVITRYGHGRDNTVAVRIADTGGGIPAAIRNNIFTPFFTTKANGTGLGLPIANRIILNHSGKLRVRNHPGGGAEFTIILPVLEK